MTESLYQEIILDHYRNPHHKGLREPFDVEVHHVNPTCGDEVTVRVAVSDGQVTDVSYDGQGCSISQASTSVMTDLVIGESVDDALVKAGAFLALMQSRGTVEPDEHVLEDGIAFAGVSRYPARVKCALLGWMAWKDATAQAVSAGSATGAASPAAVASPPATASPSPAPSRDHEERSAAGALGTPSVRQTP